MDVQSLDVEDYHDFVNSVLDGPSLEAVVSFRIDWAASRTKRRFHNVAARYDANMVLTSARCGWTGETDEARFVADPASSISIYAEVGEIRNGVFFS